LACIAGFGISVPLAAQDLGTPRVYTATSGLQSAGALSDAAFANAPFSADAVTTVTQTLGDGTKIEQRTTARWYRDSSGRVRREQTVIGLDSLNPQAPPISTITFDSVPDDPQPYTLDPATRSARRAPRGIQWFPVTGSLYTSSTLRARIRGGDFPGNVISINRPYTLATSDTRTAPIPTDLKPTEEQLGTRQVEGVKATGRRRTTVIPAGRIGNDRPIQIVEEQWESPELNMVVSSRFSDPRTGVVEYRLTNINRSEPRADLFTVPADYTIVDAGAGYFDAVGGAAGRGGQRGRGQRGGRSQ
jgi:hypothetical protein